MLDYIQLNLLAQQIKEINIYVPPFEGSFYKRGERIGKAAVKQEVGAVEVFRSELGVTISVLADVGWGWSGLWAMTFDPDQQPETEEDFWKYLEEHIFIREDFPEKTVPPPDSPLAKMLYIPQTLTARWILKSNPYLKSETK